MDDVLPVISKSERKRQFAQLLKHIEQLCNSKPALLKRFQLDADFIAELGRIGTLRPYVRNRELAHLRTKVAKNSDLWQKISHCFEASGKLIVNKNNREQQYSLDLLLQDPLALQQWLQEHPTHNAQQVRQALRNYSKNPQSQKHANKLRQLLFFSD